ncbi:MAG: hypothetical protein JO307_07310 [Bryobacterales bacterium]|nr:hypothetical protein [Bryobacterales bacterium]MBV9396724.1 hypothetical protein [Bryobacterales bacterium]
MLSALMAVWVAATAILVALLIYRALLSMKEDDQIFLGVGEQHMAKQQQVLVGKLQSIGRYSIIFGVLSVVLLLAIAGVYTYQELMRPPIS